MKTIVLWAVFIATQQIWEVSIVLKNVTHLIVENCDIWENLVHNFGKLACPENILITCSPPTTPPPTTPPLAHILGKQNIN